MVLVSADNYPATLAARNELVEMVYSRFWSFLTESVVEAVAVAVVVS